MLEEQALEIQVPQFSFFFFFRLVFVRHATKLQMLSILVIAAV